MEVYLDPCTINCRKVLAGLDLIGTDFTLKHIDYFAGEQKSEAYLKVNRGATIPAAVVQGGHVIPESNAILQYAADLGGGSPYYPKDLVQRSAVNAWLLWEASAWFPSCYKYLVEYVVMPLLKKEPNQATIDDEAPRWNQLAAVLEAQLGKTRWLAGDDVTIADLAVASPMHLHAASRLPLDKYPHLRRWMTESVEALPCWKKTQGAVDKALLPEQ